MVIAVASGKGGTGKTTVATSLALSLDRPLDRAECDSVRSGFNSGRSSMVFLDCAVLTIEDGEIVERELREKMGHAQFRHEGGRETDAQGRHGYGTGAADRHSRMAASVADCQVLLCRGMGWGAYESMKQQGITPIVTDITDIDAAVRGYLDGTLADHRELLH